MNDASQHPIQQESEDQTDIDPALAEMIDQLCSDDAHEWAQAALAILELSPGKDADEIALIIHNSREDSALSLFGWVQFCLQTGRRISSNWIEATFSGVLRNYQESVQIILHGTESDRLAEKKSGIKAMQGRIKDVTYRLTQHEDEQVKCYGYCMKLKVMVIFGEDIQRIQAVYDTCPLFVQQSEEIIEILADGYEKAKDYPRAYDLYNTLQVRTGKAHFLGCQIELLYKMGRIEEAKALYKFGSTAGIHGNILFPECVYRGTIKTDAELGEVYQALLPLYKGDRIDAVITKIIQSATEYVIRGLTEVESHFIVAGKRDEDIYNEEFHRLWGRKVFLLEVVVGMLGYTGPFGPFPEGVGMEYILTLRDLFGEHQEVPEGSILDYYFSEYDQEWMDRVRDLHSDTSHQEQADAWDDEGREEVGGDEKKSDWIYPIGQDAFAEVLKNSFVTQRLNNILDFLLDRVENDHGDNKELLDEILDFQMELSEHAKDISPIDISDVRFAGDLVRKSVASFSSSDRDSYKTLVDYIGDQYGPSIYQFLFFLSANTSQSDNLAFTGIQKDPKLLLLSIVITLLSLDTPPLPRIREFISNPILEAFSEGETIFLCRMLYRAGLFREVCTFLIEDREAFGYAECVELFFQALTCVDKVSRQEFFEGGLDAIDDFGDYEDFNEFIAAMKEDKPETTPHLVHAKMILDTLSDTSRVNTNQVPTFTPDTKFTAHEASIQLTLLRSMEVQKGDREKWTRALIFLYPFLDIDKKHALDAIFHWTFYFAWRDELERFIAIGQSDGFSPGYWQYAPLLLGNEQEQQQGINEIAKDPFLHVIPESIIWWIDTHFSDELNDPHQGSISLGKRFQLSYITAYSGLQGNDKLEKIALHFQRLEAYIQTCLEGKPRLDASSLERVFELFYTTEHLQRGDVQMDPVNGDRVLSSSEVLVNLLLKHVSEFQRYLDLCWDDQVDGDINNDESYLYLKGVIGSIESIADLFDHNSDEYIKLSSLVYHLKNEGWIPSNQQTQRDRICEDWRIPLPSNFS